MNLTETFARRLREVRERRGLSMRELADMLPEVSYPTLIRLETGKRKGVTLEELCSVAQALNVSPLSLMVPADDDAEVQLPAGRMVRGAELRAWLAGEWVLPGAAAGELEEYLDNEPDAALEAHLRARNPHVTEYVVENLRRRPGIDLDLVDDAYEHYLVHHLGVDPYDVARHGGDVTMAERARRQRSSNRDNEQED